MADTATRNQDWWSEIRVLSNPERLKVLRRKEQGVMDYLVFIESCIRDVKEEMTQGGRGV